MPLILPGNVASATASTGFNVANSIMMDHGSTSKLTRSHSGTPTSDKIGTFSCWVKFQPGSTHAICHSNDSSADERCYMNINSGGNLGGTWRNADRSTESDYSTSSSEPLFRDPGAWYHIVWAWDTTDGTAGNRLKVYVNNSQVTLTFSGSGIPQNTAIPQSKNSFDLDMGYHEDGNDGYGSGLKGYMAEVVFVDGQQLTPSSFGEADEDSPNIWKPKDGIADDITFGTFGFYYKFEDASNLDTDSSGNSNGASTTSNLTQMTDTPTNNFATLNPLAVPTPGGANTFSKGNLVITNSADAFRSSFSTIAVSAGKWYCEAKWVSGEMKQYIGIAKPQEEMDYVGESANSYSFQGENARKYNNGSQTSFGSTASTGDIVMMAFDADNGTIWTGKNGTWFASATEAEIEAGTTTNAMYSSITMDDFFVVGVTVEDSNLEMNFGSPPYSISSSNSDKNGYGSFEYSVPDGFLAICTKNLGSDGG